MTRGMNRSIPTGTRITPFADRCDELYLVRMSAIQHIADEHQWKDTMFTDFYGRFGSAKGVNIKQRLSVDKAPTWAQFLEHVGGPEGPYYRYVFHLMRIRLIQGRTAMNHYSTGQKWQIPVIRSTPTSNSLPEVSSVGCRS